MGRLKAISIFSGAIVLERFARSLVIRRLRVRSPNHPRTLHTIYLHWKNSASAGNSRVTIPH